MMAQNPQSALETWRERLEFFQQQLAIASDHGQKFELQKQIEECQQKIQELLQVQSVSQPLNPPHSITRGEVMRLLNQLVPQQFNELLFEFNPPSGIIPPYLAPQADRVYALLTWAESATGDGLGRIQEALDKIRNP